FRRGKLAKDVPAQSAEASTETDTEWQLPDLFVVDGGRGQLGVALAAAHDLGLHDLPICGLAKEKENVLGDKLVDRVYLPGQKNPIPLRPNSPELFLLARARDEAHRFSNRGRKKVGKKRRLSSELDQVPGIGPKTRTALLKTLGSLSGVRSATDEAILGVPGVSKKHLRALREWFDSGPSGEPPA
ncbi:MAG TPA: helix-hairpin-helix domain-containing protein, partial [Polyangiaceae bacterium]